MFEHRKQLPKYSPGTLVVCSPVQLYEKDDTAHANCPASIVGSYSWSRYVIVLSDTHQTYSLLYIIVTPTDVYVDTLR